ncbi:MAG: SDR family NAD(P)-dependent oxidoreductase, partial [Acidobacteria bacterium]|nr:SDR family NAD(P)-dependent oxidoreductase [Acidobacteriota bacterium]
MQTGMEIAIIGMAGRFPGAKNLEEYWENLKQAKETITFFTGKELHESGVSSGELDNPQYVKACGVIEDIAYFDASFFGYTPKEAELMDPQLRIFHECVWHALEDAGYNPGVYEGLIGLYAGASPNTSWQARVFIPGKENDIGNFAAHQLVQKDFLTLRISYKLNLKGPSFELSTACSTSLTAVHVACQALLNGECDMAAAGGIRIANLDKRGYLYREGMVASPDGHCRAFAAGSKGTVAADGVGVVILKPLPDAIENRDHIYAVIKGTAINNDGARKAGFSASSVEGQAEVIRMALQVAEVEPGSIGYIETHGTGTELGDPVEMEALKWAFNTEKKSFCAVGSVKTNIGHTDAAAGVAGLIKTVLALSHRLIPPSLHFEIPNPYIDFINSPFYITTHLTGWEQGESPRRAGVSAFGIGGTNAHVVLEEWPEARTQEKGSGQYRLILLSALSEPALDKMKFHLAAYLQRCPGINLDDAAYTLQVGRKEFNHRWLAICASTGEAIAALTSPGQGERHVVLPAEEKPKPIKIDRDDCKDGKDDKNDKEWLIKIGKLWLHGQKIDWPALYREENLHRISLPGYSFAREKYWLDLEMKKFIEPVPQVPDIGDWFYLPTWKNSPLMLPVDNTGADNTTGPLSCLVFMTDLSLANLVVECLKGIYHNVVMVKIADSFNRVNNELYTLNPGEYRHYEHLLEDLRSRDLLPHKIIHLWNITADHPGESFNSDQETGFFSLLHTAAALGKQDFQHEIQVYVLTNHVQEVLGNEPLNPGKATIPGLLKVIPQEYTGIHCCHIDIELPTPGTAAEETLMELLREEFLLKPGEMELEIAYRNNQRWVQIYDPLHLEPAATEELKLKLRQNGVFLITGGLGKIGLMFAELFVKQAGAHLLLTGRSPWPGEDSWPVKKISAMSALGSKIIYRQADAADLEKMHAVIDEAEKILGPINGIIHAAGLTEGSSIKIIRDLTPGDCRVQFQAKVWGTLVLEEIFKNKKLDFCWLLSSISCVLGGLGFGAYASANRFMDALVKKHNRAYPSNLHHSR